tara:strand:- start:963 stop:1829 length:867 start_codon:yes stop_codon:yes gene_type:complete
MLTPYSVNVTSFGDALNSLDIIIDAFKSKGLLVIKGHRFSQDEQIALTEAMGDVLDWNFHTGTADITDDASSPRSAIYPGGHSDQENRDYSTQGKDDYVLDWHIEQVFYVDPILAGVWNMTLFTADRGNGNTRFVDSTVLYSMLSTDDQEFLDQAVVKWEKPMGSGTGPFYTKVVDIHPVTSDKTLRVETDHGCYVMPHLVQWAGSEPTAEQVSRYDKLWEWLKSQLNTNEDIRHVQEWQEADLLVVDLFRMYHSVMGGFKFGERQFTGIGVRPRNATSELYLELGAL